MVPIDSDIAGDRAREKWFSGAKDKETEREREREEGQGVEWSNDQPAYLRIEAALLGLIRVEVAFARIPQKEHLLGGRVRPGQDALLVDTAQGLQLGEKEALSH